MTLSDIGLVVFGAVLSWGYTALSDYRRNLQARHELLLTLHQEIKQIRIAALVPNYDKNSLMQWPYFEPSLFEMVIQSRLLNPKKDRGIIGLLIVLIKQICEYNNSCQVGHMIIANSIQTMHYDANHKSMYDGTIRHLASVLNILKMADDTLTKITKLPILEIEMTEISQELSNIKEPQTQNKETSIDAS